MALLPKAEEMSQREECMSCVVMGNMPMTPEGALKDSGIDNWRGNCFWFCIRAHCPSWLHLKAQL